MRARQARKILRQPWRYSPAQVVTACAAVRPWWWPPKPGMWGDAFTLHDKARHLANEAVEQDGRAILRSMWYRRSLDSHERWMREAYRAGAAKDPEDIPF